MNVNELNTLRLKSLLLSLCFVLGFFNLTAQEMFCGPVVVSLDPANCMATVTPADIIENPGDFPAFPANLSVDLFFDEAMTMPVPTSPNLTSAEIGMEIIVQVTYSVTGNSCWTTINTVADYAIPNLSCSSTPININCIDDLTPSTAAGASIGFPVSAGVSVTDNGNGTYTLQNFDACGSATLTYVDASV